MTPGRLLYLMRRRLKLGARHALAELLLDGRIERWRMPQGADESAAVPLHFLASRHDWRMALWMLASLHHFTGLRWPLVLHEDGSLGDAEIGVFTRMFPGLRIVRRAEADRLMAPRLADFPRCAEYRRRMPHGLKSFDIPQLAEAPRFLLLDPDVLFFATPEKILDWAGDSSDESCWFNRDFQEPSPVSPDQALAQFGVDLWPRVNSGLCLLTRRSVGDLGAMEKWLAHPALQDSRNQWRVEQTLLALCASRAGRGGLLPDSYEVSPQQHRRRGGVSRHYVGCVRERFLGEGVFSLSKPLTSAGS